MAQADSYEMTLIAAYYKVKEERRIEEEQRRKVQEHARAQIRTARRRR